MALPPTLNPIEKLRKAACRAFPDIPQLASIELTSSLKIAWQRLASAAGVSISAFAQAISAETKTPLATSLRPTPEALRVLPAPGVRKNLCLPVALDNGVLSVVIANPCDDELIKFIRFAKSEVQLLLAPPDEIDEASQIAYSHHAATTGKRSTGFLVLDPKHPAGRDEHAVIRLGKQLLQEVVGLGASDLHIQPFLGGGAIRTRLPIAQIVLFEQLRQAFGQIDLIQAVRIATLRDPKHLYEGCNKRQPRTALPVKRSPTPRSNRGGGQ